MRLKRFCGKNSAVSLLALSATAQYTKDSKFAVRISRGRRVQNLKFEIRTEDITGSQGRVQNLKLLFRSVSIPVAGILNQLYSSKNITEALLA